MFPSLNSGRHSTNIFTAMPDFTAGELVPAISPTTPTHTATTSSLSEVEKMSFEGRDVTCLDEILSYLEVVLEGTSLSTQKEQLLPVLTALASISRAERVIRKYCRSRVCDPSVSVWESGRSQCGRFSKELFDLIATTSHYSFSLTNLIFYCSVHRISPLASTSLDFNLK